MRYLFPSSRGQQKQTTQKVPEEAESRRQDTGSKESSLSTSERTNNRGAYAGTHRQTHTYNKPFFVIPGSSEVKYVGT